MRQVNEAPGAVLVRKGEGTLHKYLVLSEKDNVAVATDNLGKGTLVELPQGSIVEIKNKIPFAHKFALKDLVEGDSILKYGEVIGKATGGIAAGEHVHTHNIRGFYVSGVEV